MKNVTIREELDVLRNRFAGCEIVAFADLSTGMVLASSTENKLAQEKLDALCADGSVALSGTAAKAVTNGSGRTEPAVVNLAMCSKGTRISCFVRAPEPAEEALCFVFRPDSALDDVPRSAKEVLARIASET